MGGVEVREGVCGVCMGSFVLFFFVFVFVFFFVVLFFFFFQAEDGIRSLVRSRGLGDVYTGQGK